MNHGAYGSLPVALSLSLLSYTNQDEPQGQHPLPSGLGPPMSFINQENAPPQTRP